MAPEVYRHEPYNNKVDVYSFSMIAFQLLEGYPPFWTMDPIQAARRAALEGLRPEWGKANRWGPGAGTLRWADAASSSGKAMMMCIAPCCNNALCLIVHCTEHSKNMCACLPH